MQKNIFFCLSLLVLLSACGGEKDPLAAKKAKHKALKTEISALELELTKLDTAAASLAQKESRERLVSASAIVAAPFTHYIELQGNIIADQEIYVTPKMPGTVTRMLVKTGAQVKSGQLLAEMDDALFSQNRAAMQTQLDLASSLYQKQKQLWDQKIGSEIQFLQAKNGMESLQKQMLVLDEQAQQTKVFAPISGVVDEVTMKVGMPSAPGAIMSSIRIVNLSQLKVKADVPEAYAGKLRDGGAALLSFPDLDREMNSKISYVSKVISPMNRTFSVELLVPGGSKDLVPNLTTMVKIADYAKANAIVVPINAVQKDLQGDYVYVVLVEGGKSIARKARIKLGQVFGDQAEILSGLNVGDQLIVVGYQDVNEGEVVKFK